MNTARRVRLGNLAHQWTPRFVILPSAVATLVFVYGFILFTLYISFTSSKILPFFVFDWVGFENFKILFSQSLWIATLKNLAIFGGGYIIFTVFIGIVLAIFINQYVVGEKVLRPIYLYPMAISFIVTGTAWKWFLDPGIGLQAIVNSWGWENFTFTWIKDNDLAIFCVILAAVWQATGFVMTIFLSGLRAINQSTVEAARVDGVNSFRLYVNIIMPQLAPSFLSAFVILGHLAIKSYDLVVALTSGGPGTATWLPSTFMFEFTFTRRQAAVGSSAAVIMLILIAMFIVPYVRRELKGEQT